MSVRRPAFGGAMLAACGALAAGGAYAHAFTQPYTLPVPFAMYASGAAAALLLSFVVVGVFAGAAGAMAPHVQPTPYASSAREELAPLTAGRWAWLLLLALCIACGWFGTQNAFSNLNMTLFWIVFVLGVPYVVAMAGDFYAPVNPWRTLAELLARSGALPVQGRWPYPERVGYVPALLLYIAFIWLELFGHAGPRGLSNALAAYTAINLAGAWAFGARDWFRYGEFFGVFLRLTGKMSPVARSWDPQERRAAGPGAPRWRAPFIGLLQEPATHLSLVVFILFMLSSTAFDGLHETTPWTQLFWKQVYPAIAGWVPTAPGRTYAVSAQLYYVWQWLSLLVSPFAYLVLFAAFLLLAKAVTGSPASLKLLVLRFAMSLLPIAFVYHVTHYYTMLLAQGGQLWKLVSDPFGWGWNLLGTARHTVSPWMLDADTIWHTQVALILVGHIVSVYLAHLEALQVFASPRRATVSQLPMLVLMMLFTTLGLWILSLPLAS